LKNRRPWKSPVAVAGAIATSVQALDVKYFERVRTSVGEALWRIGGSEPSTAVMAANFTPATPSA